MDYSSAPTLSFPVLRTLMVEPGSEPKEEMDRFIEALVAIKRECEAAAAAGTADNVVANAPPRPPSAGRGSPTLFRAWRPPSRSNGSAARSSSPT